jgi:hypothetical protein
VSPGQIVALVAVILIPIAAIVTTLIVWLTRKSAASHARLDAELLTEPAIRGPERGTYQGSTGAYPKVRGTGRIALTADRLIFRKLTGPGIDVALKDVTGVHTSKRFNGAVVGGSMHLVVETRRGEVGYLVTDTDGWLAAVKAAAGL